MTATRAPADATATPAEQLRVLFDEHSPFVWRSLQRLGVDTSDLDDMVQEVFLVVYQRMADYQERNRVRSWLYAICIHVAKAQRRKVTRRRENVTHEPPEERLAATQLQRVEDREALAFGQKLLALLPPDQREVFVLYEVEHLPMAQIAEAIGCPLYTAYSRLRIARQRIVAEVERAERLGARR
ncbi:MAG: hypothetical protein RLZZ450_6018 [Pseudomonadota bacterium]